MEKPAFFTPEIASQKQLKHHLGSTSSSNSSGLCRQPVPDRSLLRFLSPFGATPPPDMPGLVHCSGRYFRKSYISRMLARYSGDMNQGKNAVFLCFLGEGF